MASEPWVPRQWSGYAKFWFSYHRSLGFDDSVGDSIDYGSYHELSLNSYLRLGLGYGLALVVHFPLVRAAIVADTLTSKNRTHVALSDPELALRYQLLTVDRFVIGIEFGTRFPIAPKNPLQTLHPLDQSTVLGKFRLGTGRFDIRGSVALGYAWRYAYLSTSASYTFRTAGFAPIAGWTVAGGGRIAQRWTLRARVSGHHPLFGLNSATLENSPSGIGNGVAYIGLAASVEYLASQTVSVGLSIEGSLGYARRRSRGPESSFFVALTF